MGTLLRVFERSVYCLLMPNNGHAKWKTWFVSLFFFIGLQCINYCIAKMALAFLCLCLCVRACVRAYVRACVSVCVYIRARVCGYMCLCMCVRVSANLCSVT